MSGAEADERGALIDHARECPGKAPLAAGRLAARRPGRQIRVRVIVLEASDMAIQFLKKADAKRLIMDGKISAQLLSVENAPDAQTTITRVTMEPGAISPRHVHSRSEQTWIVEAGLATLLLAKGRTASIQRGDIIRTPAGEVHGLENTGVENFVYLTVTTPPENMAPFYPA